MWSEETNSIKDMHRTILGTVFQWSDLGRESLVREALADSEKVDLRLGNALWK